MKMHCIPKRKVNFFRISSMEENTECLINSHISILGKDDQSEATHVIYPEGNDCASNGGKWNEVLVKNAFHVVDQWLEDSIKLKERQDEKLYRVR